MNWFSEWKKSTVAGRLNEKGILGMNSRNILYIGRYNPRQLFPLVDDKLQTKTLALENSVNVPELIGVIDSQHEVKKIAELTRNYNGFCIKPAKGSGGKGILVITRSQGDVYIRSNGQEIRLKDIHRHISNILAGLFSLGGSTDVAVIETLIQVDDAFLKYSFEGVPDLRVIVFCGFPVMAMMRLSCAESSGKANLHQGAVGVGIDIATGRAVRAVQHGKTVVQHPDTKQDLVELEVPQWHDMLKLACACYDMTGLGYIGVDLVLDKHRGPLLLELNARPGLAIQVANNAGLLPRLLKVQELKKPERFTIEQRLNFSIKHFAEPSVAQKAVASESA